jgi:hypothetical protein
MSNKMERGINHVQWCMDACRWDTFVMTNISNMATLRDFRMVYSRAGMTPSSLFATWANLPWYESVMVRDLYHGWMI